MVVALDRLGQALDGSGLGQPRCPLDKEVAIGQQGDKQAVDQPFLSHNLFIESPLKGCNRLELG